MKDDNSSRKHWGITMESGKRSASPENPLAAGGKWAAISIAAAFFFMTIMIGVKHDPGAIFGIIASAVFMVPILYWMKNRHEINKQKLKLQEQVQGVLPETPRMKRMEERLENLETLICRLDSELNYQMEKSLAARLNVPESPSGVSQMPTMMTQLAGALESRYQILQELGRGGMGVVFQAYDKQLQEQVAIKLLSPFLSHDADALQRLKREVSAARRITHSNVIRIHDIGEAGGLHYVSMEFFSGKNLKEYVRQSGSLSVMQIHQIVAQICDGLEAAHQQGVVHRDLKSQNIIVNSSGQTKIIDFGLARTTHLEGMTATGLIMGTPEYMAPEQVAGKRVDERADIYSLGIILYELFTGRVPFRGESAISVGFQQLKDDPPRPRDVNPGIPPEFEAIILKALEKEPGQRFQTIREMRTALDQAAGHPARIAEISAVPAPGSVSVENE